MGLAKKKEWGDLLPVSVCVLALGLKCLPVLGRKIGARFGGGCTSTRLETASIMVFVEGDAATLRLPKTQAVGLNETQHEFEYRTTEMVARDAVQQFAQRLKVVLDLCRCHGY